MMPASYCCYTSIIQQLMSSLHDLFEVGPLEKVEATDLQVLNVPTPFSLKALEAEERRN